MSLRCLCSIPLLMLLGCAQGVTPSPRPLAEPQTLPPQVVPGSLPATPKPAHLAGQALLRLLGCGEPGFFQLPASEQRDSLVVEPRVQCFDDRGEVACTPTEPLSAFGLHVFGFRLVLADGGEELRVRARGDEATLDEAIAAAWPRPTRTGGEGGWRALTPAGDFAIRTEAGAEPGEVRYTCRRAAPGEDLFATASAPRPGTGVISGGIEYPGEETPALRVCAISVDDPARHRCLRTVRGATQYRIDGLQAGDYEVWAWVLAPEADVRLLRAMQDVQCIRAPCPRQPLTVTLAEGAQMAQVTLDEAAAGFDDAPPIPAED